jgi:DNA invertase Pin-like site-specific DNA recombinase
LCHVGAQCDHDLRLCPRLATDAQDLTSQRSQLTAAGCEKSVQQKITGTTADRPQLQKLMKALPPAHRSVAGR